MKVPIVCRQFTRGNRAKMKTRKSSKEKTDKLQKGNWNDKRFDR